MGRFVWVLIGFAVGLAAGWAVTLEFSPEWVGAVGTCVGAVGTIATIIWAVHSFQQETRRRQEDVGREREGELKREYALAENVHVRCSGGSADGFQGGPGEPNTWSLNSVWIRLINGTSEPITIEHFELPGITFRGSVLRILPSTLRGGETFRETIDVEPMKVSDEEVSDKGPLKDTTPVLRYRIAGVTWERVGDYPPLRVSADR